MELSRDTKLEILGINLDALKSDDRQDAIIQTDQKTFNMWINHLVSLERYEDCAILKKNEEKLLEHEKICQAIPCC